MPARAARQLFEFLRAELPFYRVEYDIQRGGVSTHVRTPRWTTVFGLDETSRFRDAGANTGTLNAPDSAAPGPQTGPQTGSSPSVTPRVGQPGPSPASSEVAPLVAPNRSATVGAVIDDDNDDWDVVDARAGRPVVRGDRHYARCRPRPIPACLEALRRGAERATGCRFNFCLVNYYASGRDSISPHSDDERFLGDRPAIASLSLGARRDFVMRHKGDAGPSHGEKEEEGDGGKGGKANRKGEDEVVARTSLKLPLGSGDMVLMRGTTQSKWLHSIPKRTGRNAEDGGRINITFRRAMVKGGTENYYNYNVGTGPVHRWDTARREMKPWKESP
jgi:alkylated DNA repair dioxygenase AlkB